MTCLTQVPALIEVDERDGEGRTALMWAAMVDDDQGLACVRAILEHCPAAWYVPLRKMHDRSGARRRTCTG